MAELVSIGDKTALPLGLHLGHCHFKMILIAPLVVSTLFGVLLTLATSLGDINGRVPPSSQVIAATHLSQPSFIEFTNNDMSSLPANGAVSPVDRIPNPVEAPRPFDDGASAPIRTFPEEIIVDNPNQFRRSVQHDRKSSKREETVIDGHDSFPMTRVKVDDDYGTTVYQRPFMRPPGIGGLGGGGFDPGFIGGVGGPHGFGRFGMGIGGAGPPLMPIRF